MTKKEQNRKMRIIWMSFVLILWSIWSSAQSPIDISLQKYSPVSPEAASLIRYVECPVDLIHGLVPIEIPIYEIQMDGLRLPISLSYHSGGIKVQDMGGIMGLGWSLNADPSVTRTVQGKPDESYRGLLNNPGFGGITHDYLKLLANCDADEDPDAFYYKLAGRSGGFYLDRFSSGAAFLFPPAPVKVAYSSSYITILDEDGTLYEFGGQTDFLEKNIVIGSADDYFSRWAANRIKSAESGREITFQHSLGADFSIISLPKMNHSVSIEVINNRASLISVTKGGSTQSYTWDNQTQTMTPLTAGPSMTNGSQMRDETVKRRFLTAINFPEGRVTFEYTNPWLLYKITIYNKQGQTIKTARMFYDCYNTCTSNSRRYLMDSVRITNSIGQVEERYHFEYDRPYLLPDVNSSGIDHWGYYNGATNNILVPSFSFNTGIHQVNYQGGNRNANEDDMKIGSLKRIYWPGGRTTDFHYGPNEYGIHIPSEPNERVVTGGLRIETIKESDGVWSSWRYFNYKEPLYEGFKYHGKPKILINTNLYCVERVKATSNEADYSKLYTWYSNPVPNLFFSSGSPVAYETVYETRFNDDNEWKFTYLYSLNGPVNRTDLREPFYPETINRSSFEKMTDMEEYYRTDEVSWNGSPVYKKVRHTKYEYSNIKSSSVGGFRKAYNYRILPSYNPNNYLEDFKIFHSSYYLAYMAPIKETVTEYPATGVSISTVKQYGYSNSSDHLRPVTVTTKQSNGANITEQFSYPQDMPSSVNLGQQDLISSWKINALLEHRHPQMTVRNEYYGTKLKTVLSNTGATLSFEPRLHYEYDSYGNPKSANVEAGAKTVYLWSYHWQLPVAVVENASYQDVVAALGGQAVVDAIAAKEYPSQNDMNLMSGLRQTLPGAMVTTYTHKPLVGVISITDPAGRKMNYEYDPSGRLMRVTDEDGKILSAHRYNLVLPN